MKYYNAILSTDPFYEAALFNKGTALIRINKIEEGIPFLKKLPIDSYLYERSLSELVSAYWKIGNE